MYLIQLLLPLDARDGHNVGHEAFARTREELAEAFDGVTAYGRSPAQGVWVAPSGEKQRDHVLMIEVMADTFDRAWWRNYMSTLERRFDQEIIHIRALPAEMP